MEYRIGNRTLQRFVGLFACTVLIEPSCPVLMADIRSTTEPSRVSPRMIRSPLTMKK
jgi:hypothetical protein